MSRSSYIAKSLRYCGNQFLIWAAPVVLPILFAVGVFPAHAQYFNLRIDFMEYDHAEVAFSLEQMNNGNYIVFHSARPEAADNLGLGRSIISPEGEVLEQSAHFDPITVLYTGYSNTSFKLAGGGFVTSGSRSWSSGIESLITLCRYNEVGELDWIRFYSDSLNQTIGKAAVQQLNLDIAAVGSKSSGIPDDTEAFLLITDSLGNELEFKVFGGSNWDNFFSIYPTFDGGYILGGYSTSYGTIGKWDHYLVKTDSVGNQEWMEVLGSEFDDCPAKVIQTADSNYVFCGCWTHYSEGTGINYSKLFMAKLDQEGDLIWEKEYLEEPVLYGNLRKVVELPNGDLFTAGFGGNAEHAYLLRTDAEGNELWMRNITHPSLSEFGIQLIYDVIADDTGGFVGTGWMLNPNNSPEPGQDLWVFRTDSMGCLVPGCHIVDNVEVHEEEVLVIMFPNPVKDLLSVHLKSGPMPRGAQLELFDVQGRRHSTIAINPGATTYILPMGHLPAGMYVLRCVTGGAVVWSGKVLKE